MAIISQDELRVLAGEKGFGLAILEKDYLVTHLLFFLKDVEGIYFKGGTALNKIFLNHARLSEDLDFTATADIKTVEQKIRGILKGTIFEKITHDKRVDRFIRLIVHYRLYHDEGTIFIDLNERGKLLLPPESYEVKHFYPGYIPRFFVKTLNVRELIAEKMSAAIGRNRPRDHFDLYQIIEKGFTIDLGMARKKCELSGREFDITKMFNKAQKLKKQWDEDLGQFLQEKISFVEVMTALARHFHLKHEKNLKKREVVQ
ncbi:nucleotidyl transferase AbiEii/AbiGii toxin family protein [Candidatus Woesearchaeota archaeon]|nr:nucleotidyl transferase AbiEii/AbiGii toxin family protein [Candidatus Woesearchaeota archaeon]